MIPVSVVIVTHNEERNIEDALRSAADFDEIIVVDSFSTDRTVEICKKYTDKIYQHEWPGFAKQKQRAVDYASGPWVFILDADERITAELREEIAGTIERTVQDGFSVPRKNYFLGRWIRHSGWWPDRTLRLFRKGKGALEDREVHEKVVVSGSVGNLKGCLEHYTYRTISDYIRKMETYSTLAAREIRKKSGRPGVVSLLIKPCFTFLKMYILRFGFLDGMHGMILAVLYGYYTFLKYAKAWELE
ncbi:MAG: glycosyltransferase family 2 protein [Nitrospirota bacterium]|nr:glycosyltransferase family 2 protein [Nitrospirota bacterium]